MKKIIILLIAVFTTFQVSSQIENFNSVLQKYVSKKGDVDYKLLKENSFELDAFLKYLEKTAPEKSWSKPKQKAFWINVYNAYTIKLILEHYPLKSIMNIKKKGKSAWKIPFVKVGGKTYTLDFVEHNILREKFFDPKIHVGVNCASESCPKLANIAFTEENVEAELTRLMKDFVNDVTKNKLSEKKLQISSIFDWFKDDFTKKGTIVEYLNQYSEIKIKPTAKISYLKYNWSLNEK